MFVVEVWTLRLPSLSRMSAGSPESGSVIAASEAQVRSAYSCSLPSRAGAPAAGTRISSKTSAARNVARMLIPLPIPQRRRNPVGA
jgi:hypothetical protein